MSSRCMELLVQLKNIRKVQNNLNTMIEVCSNFQYNPASLTAVKSRQLGDIYKMRQKLMSLIEATDFEVYDTEADFLNYKGLVRWLRLTKAEDGKSLESKLEGGSFEKHIRFQEEFYQEKYGIDFKLNLDSIEVDKSRLKAIKKGLENGFANYPLIVATPDTLTEYEKKLTKAQFAYQKFVTMNMSELWVLGSTINDPNKVNEYLGDCNDIDFIELNNKYTSEMNRALSEENPARISPKELKVIFTDSRSQIPQIQKTVDKFGVEIDQSERRNWYEIVSKQVQALTLQQWIILASQLHEKNGSVLSKGQDNWLASVNQVNWLTNRPKNKPKNWRDVCKPFLTAGHGGGIFVIDGHDSHSQVQSIRWRSAL